MADLPHPQPPVYATWTTLDEWEWRRLVDGLAILSGELPQGLAQKIVPVLDAYPGNWHRTFAIIRDRVLAGERFPAVVAELTPKPREQFIHCTPALPWNHTDRAAPVIHHGAQVTSTFMDGDQEIKVNTCPNCGYTWCEPECL